MAAFSQARQATGWRSLHDLLVMYSTIDLATFHMWSSNALMPFDPLIGTPATLRLPCTTPIGVVVVLINSEINSRLFMQKLVH